MLVACSSKQPLPSVSVPRIGRQQRMRGLKKRRKKQQSAVVKTLHARFECTRDGLYGSRQHFRNANVIVTRDLIRSNGRNRRTGASWRTEATLAYLAMPFTSKWHRRNCFTYFKVKKRLRYDKKKLANSSTIVAALLLVAAIHHSRAPHNFFSRICRSRRTPRDFTLTRKVFSV